MKRLLLFFSLVLITTVTANAQNKTFKVNGISFSMVKVKGGTFTMGATGEQIGDADDGEMPAHKVTLSNYYIGQTEVTQALWQAVMGYNPSYFSDNNQRPVDHVNWDDCQEFISKLNSLTGEHFRLPTEAEWEFAARGGNKNKGYKYSGHDVPGRVAWFLANIRGTSVVGQKDPNELGIYDMSGNVWEWCTDWFGNYSSASQTNPQGPSTGTYRVVRGGSWLNAADCLRVSKRGGDYPNCGTYSNGFRLAL